MVRIGSTEKGRMRMTRIGSNLKLGVDGRVIVRTTRDKIEVRSVKTGFLTKLFLVIFCSLAKVMVKVGSFMPDLRQNHANVSLGGSNLTLARCSSHPINGRSQIQGPSPAHCSAAEEESSVKVSSSSPFC